MNTIYNAMLYCYCYLQTLEFHAYNMIADRRSARVNG